jgi:hypothetical protein
VLAGNLDGVAVDHVITQACRGNQGREPRPAGSKAAQPPSGGAGDRSLYPICIVYGLGLPLVRYGVRSAVTPETGTESIGARFQRCRVPGGGSSPARRPSPPEGALYEPYERSFPNRLRHLREVRIPLGYV